MAKKKTKPAMAEEKALIHISPMQQLIIEKIAQGYSNESVAYELDIDTKEVVDLVRSPHVQAAIQKASQEVLRQFGSKESITNAMKRIIMSDLTDFYTDDGQGNLTFKPINQIPMYLRQCITKFKVKHTKDSMGMPVQDVEIEVISKEKAIEVLARLEGLYSDKPQDDHTTINIGFE